MGPLAQAAGVQASYNDAMNESLLAAVLLFGTPLAALAAAPAAAPTRQAQILAMADHWVDLKTAAQYKLLREIEADVARDEDGRFYQPDINKLQAAVRSEEAEEHRHLAAVGARARAEAVLHSVPQNEIESRRIALDRVYGLRMVRLYGNVYPQGITDILQHATFDHAAWPVSVTEEEIAPLIGDAARASGVPNDVLFNPKSYLVKDMDEALRRTHLP